MVDGPVSNILNSILGEVKMFTGLSEIQVGRLGAWPEQHEGFEAHPL